MTVNINNVLGEFTKGTNIALMAGSGIVSAIVAYTHPEILPFDPVPVKDIKDVPSVKSSSVDIDSLINDDSYVSSDVNFSKTSTASLSNVEEGKWIGKNFNLRYDGSEDNKQFGGRVAIMSENGINFFRCYTEQYKMNMGVIGQIVPVKSKNTKIEDIGIDFQYRVRTNWNSAGAYVVINFIPLSVWKMKDKIDPFLFSVHTAKVPVKVYGDWQRFIFYNNSDVVEKLNKYIELTGGEPFVISVGAVKSNMDSKDVIDIRDTKFVVRYEIDKRKERMNKTLFHNVPVMGNLGGNGVVSPWDM